MLVYSVLVHLDLYGRLILELRLAGYSFAGLLGICFASGFLLFYIWALTRSLGSWSIPG